MCTAVDAGASNSGDYGLVIYNFLRRASAHYDARIMRNPPALEIGGIRVWFNGLGDERQKLAHVSLELALRWIERNDPVRLGRMARDLAGIIVWHFPRALRLEAQCDESSGVCQLDGRAVLGKYREMPLLIALVIVHEATHARLFRRGFGEESGRDESCRLRQEAICRRAELAFLERVPNSARLASAIRESHLELAPRYGHAQMLRRREEALRSVWIPRPIARWLAAHVHPITANELGEQSRSDSDKTQVARDD